MRQLTWFFFGWVLLLILGLCFWSRDEVADLGTD